MTTKPLTRCSACASALVYPCGAEPFGDEHALVDRRCPECERRDRVLAPRTALAAWNRQQARRMAALAGDLLVLEVEAWLHARDHLAPEAP